MLSLPVAAGMAVAQDNVPTSTEIELVRDYVEARLERGRIPGAALAIVHGDSILHIETFGIAGPSGLSVSPTTPFILGSTTKSVTATAVMVLVEAGMIGLDARVTEYLPWFRTTDQDASTRITVRHLLTHTSGLSEAVGRTRLADGDTTALALERHVRALSRVHLTSEPGSAFDYSNANYSILGRIIQEVSGQSFESVIQETILDPLNMSSSFTSQSEAELAGLATGYRFWFGYPRAAPSMPFVRGVAPAGYLISSVNDMARYLIFHIDSGMVAGIRLVTTDGMETLHRPAATMTSDLSYGMGWVIQSEGEDKTIWHNGGLPNFYSFLGWIPDRRLGVVFLANGLDILAAGQFDAIPFGVLNILRGREPTVAADMRFHPPLNVAVLWAALILLWQLGWVVASALKRKPWIVSPNQIPVSISTELRKFGLPVLFNFGWATLVLVFLPGTQATSFAVMKLYAPDFGLLAQMSAVLAIVWGTLQVTLRIGRLIRVDRGGGGSK